MKTEYLYPTHRKNTSATELKHLLVPVDLYDDANPALKCALMMAHQFEGEITLLTVIPDDHISFEYGVAQAVTLREQQMERAQRQLSQLAEATLFGVRYTIIIRIGKPFKEIIRAASEMGADLIILSKPVCSDATDVELVGTVKHVVRNATCPVLVIPLAG
jgi:nucleotide-binding universal stress UspA family protein